MIVQMFNGRDKDTHVGTLLTGAGASFLGMYPLLSSALIRQIVPPYRSHLAHRWNLSRDFI